MSDAERAVMLEHVEYWGKLLSKGTAIVYGPVFDPSGGYGIGVVDVDNEAEMFFIRDNDPTVLNGMNKMEIHPMRAVYK